jgi:hypothetical protein
MTNRYRSIKNRCRVAYIRVKNFSFLVFHREYRPRGQSRLLFVATGLAMGKDVCL